MLEALPSDPAMELGQGFTRASARTQRGEPSGWLPEVGLEESFNEVAVGKG